MLLAAAASGGAPSGALALPRAGARGPVAARAGGDGAGVAAPEAPRPWRAEGQPLPSALRAQRGLEATPRDFAPAHSEPPGGFKTTRSRPGTECSAALRDSTHLAPCRCARARRSGASRRHARPSAAVGEGHRRRRRRAYCCFARRPACLRAKRHPSRENENRRTARGNRTPTAGTRVPSHSFRPERLCEVEDTGGRVSVQATL